MEGTPAAAAMRNWDDLKFCLALSSHGTMSNAAKVLGTNVATVSRRLNRMSEEMGEALFIKQGNRWVATESGAELARIAEELQTRLGATQDGRGEIRGDVKIRISCAMQIMQSGLVSGIVHFLESHPTARLGLDSRKQSLALNECDIRIGFEEPNEGRVVRRRLMALDIVPACQGRFLGGLTGWVKVLYTDSEPPGCGRLREHFDAAPKIEIEGLNLTRLVLESNPLLALLPRSMVEGDADLAEVSMGPAFEPLPIWLSYHQSRRRDPAVRLAVEFLERALRIDADPVEAAAAC